MKPPAPGPSLRRETVLIAALSVVGAVFRFWQTGRLGLVHYDEGIYAMAGLWFTSSRGLVGMNPIVIPFAPGGYPALVGIADLFLGVSDTAAIFVSQLAGLATISLAGVIGRRAFGPGAGAASAAFAALSGPHVAFSRMALTDATFALTLLAALGLGGAFLARPGLLRAIALGLMVGLAQNVKYNGFLAGGIVALAAVLQVARKRSSRLGEAARLFGFGAIGAMIAGLVYWPWFRFVEAHGSYRGLLEHHRSYLGSLASWPRYWRTQLAEQTALSGDAFGPFQWGLWAWLLAGVGGWLAATGSRTGENGSRRLVQSGLILVLGSLAFGASGSLSWWLTLVCAPCLLRDDRAMARLLGVGWIVFAVLTPFYHPYARLWLPLLALSWPILGGLVVGLSGGDLTLTNDGCRPTRARGIALGLAVIVAFATDALPPGRPRPLRGLVAPTDSVRLAVESLAASLETMPPESRPMALRVLARPPVTFYLSLRLPRGIALQRVADFAALFQPGGPRVASLHDRGLEPPPADAESAEALRREHWRTAATFPTWLSPPTLLDHDPSAAYLPDFGPTSISAFRPMVLSLPAP